MEHYATQREKGQKRNIFRMFTGATDVFRVNNFFISSKTSCVLEKKLILRRDSIEPQSKLQQSCTSGPA